MAVRGEANRWLADALGRWLSRPVDVDDVTVTLLGKPRSGQSNQTVPFTATWRQGTQPLWLNGVARVQPPHGQMFLHADVVREAAVLTALGRAGVPVPKVLASFDARFADVPFFVMELVEGHVPYGRPSLHRDPWLIALDPSDRFLLWSHAMQTLVTVHAVELDEVRAILGTTADDETAAAEVERTATWLAWAARGRSFPVLEGAVDVLRSWAPNFNPGGSPVVVWGDARIGNMIIGDDLAVTAAIDWETASIGPRELDVGWWLMMDDYSTAAVRTEGLNGFPAPGETRSFYEDAAGVRTTDLDQFELLAALRLAITLIRTGDFLVDRGVIDSASRFSHDNVPTQMVARRLGQGVAELSPDYRRLARLED
jgi:aminoglycoside phosphotransferase (APT) family kinase protein